MKKTMLTIAGLGLASGLAIAQEQDTQEFNPDRDIVRESQPSAPEFEPNRDIVTDPDRKPQMSMGERKADSPLQTDYGSEDTQTTHDSGMTDHSDTATAQSEYGSDSAQDTTMNQGLAGMTAADLDGKKVVTLTGEEIGEISGVGESSAHQDRIATVDVGGFLGIGEKTIAIPLSELEKSVADEDSVRTSMTRESIESQPEFDDSGFTPDE